MRVGSTFLKVTLHHLFRHWRLNLMVLLAMLVGTLLLAAMPMVTAVIAGISLRQSIADATIPNRNIEIESTNPLLRLDQTHAELIDAQIGPTVQERIDIRDVALNAEGMIYHADGSRERILEFLRLRFWAFSNLDAQTELVAGKRPSATLGTAESGEVLIEIAVGTEAAEILNLQIGDQFAVDNPGVPLGSENARFRAEVVGIVSPLDPMAPTWWGDPILLPFTIFREPVSINLDRLNVSVFAETEALAAQIPAHRHYWRIILDSENMSVDTALSLRDQILVLGSQIGTHSATFNSGLPRLIDEFEVKLSQAQLTLLLLTAQSMLAVLYTLALISTFLLDRSQSDVVTLIGRGFSRWQITTLFGLETAVLAFGGALPLGPLLAHIGFQLWSRLTGTAVLNSIPAAAWGLSFFAVLLGWLALVVPLYFASRQRITDWLRQRSRPSQHPPWRRLTFDLFLLILGGLTFWQLTQIGTAVQDDGGLATADPVLLLGPTLLLLAIAFITLRLFPFIIQFLAWLSRWTARFVLPNGLTRMARDTILPSQIILLVGLAAGLTFFAAVFGHSITVRQRAIARYENGADIVLRQPRPEDLAAADLETVTEMAGVTAVSPLYRGVSRPGTRAFASLHLLAVDPDTLPLVAAFPAGISQFSMQTLANVLQPLENGRLPMILSRNGGPQNAQVGDQLDLTIGSTEAAFEITGIIADFPTLDSQFMITNLTELEKQVNLNSALLRVEGDRELWLATNPAQHNQLVAAFKMQTHEEVGLASYQAGRLIGNREAILKSFAADTTTRLAVAAFNLNAIVLLSLGSIAFLFIQTYKAQARLLEFTILRAIGLSNRQLVQLLVLENVVILGLGLITGAVVGLVLSVLMRPFLSLTLATGLGGRAIDQIAIHWPTILLYFGLLILFYAIGVGVMAILIGRQQLHTTLRLGDE